jgi:tetratricopeptide (TPR) repeat protein
MSRFAPAWSLAAVVVSTAALSLLQAQNVPKRPPIDADTNSAYAYYQYGMGIIEKQPQRAADAFYWASQIDPTWAQPLYGRRVALLMAADDQFVVGYMEGNRGATRSKQAARIDSLELHARMLNPFLNHELDAALLRRYLEAVFKLNRRVTGGSSTIDMEEFRYFAELYWRTEAPPFMRAILAASERRYGDALKFYAQALSQNKKAAGGIHLARGQIFFLMALHDSARAEIQAGLDDLRKRDAKDFVYLYESKGVLEHSIALICENQGRMDEAHEAYGRALQEDLSYYPAHLRLAVLALTAGDSATALNEMDLAAQIKEDEPWVQATYGAVLAQVGHLPEADQHLHRAIELAPFYSAPYYALGRVAEQEGRTADAIEQYHAYLARTWARDKRVSEVHDRLAALEASAAPHR